MFGEMNGEQANDTDDRSLCLGTKSGIVASVTLQISNIEHIRIAYGDDVAREASRAAEQFLRKELASSTFLSFSDTKVFYVSLSDIESVKGSTLEEKCDNLLGRLCRVIPTLTAGTATHPLHLCVAGEWRLRVGADKFVGAGAPIRFTGNPPGEDRVWIRRYREAMAQVSRVLNSLAPVVAVPKPVDGLTLYRQPIRNAALPGAVLYHKVLPRISGGFGASALLANAFPALERLGFAPLIDRAIVSQVIDALEVFPDDVLGVRLSARSLVSDGWWREVEARLHASPATARRLILEISAEAMAMSDASTISPLQGLRGLGARIAVDGFGRGAASTERLEELAPDIVRLDHFFLHDCATRQGAETFLHLLDLARSIARTVVVEGVETSAQADFVRKAGCVWQQGFYWGKPKPVARHGSGAPVGLSRIATRLKAAMMSASVSRFARRPA